jgi:hypothetical protein
MQIHDLINEASTLVNAIAYDNEDDKFIFCLDLMGLGLIEYGDKTCSDAVERLEKRFERILFVAAMVKDIRAHAIHNYNRDGWDILVECWTDEEITEKLGRVRSLGTALLRMRGYLKPLNDQRAELRATEYGG